MVVCLIDVLPRMTYFILDLSSCGISLQVLNSILRLNAEAHGLSIVFWGNLLPDLLRKLDYHY